jgi:hypothetical protein
MPRMSKKERNIRVFFEKINHFENQEFDYGSELTNQQYNKKE